MADVERTAGPAGRARVLRWALVLAVLLVVLGVGVEIGRVQAQVPAAPVDPVIVVEWEAPDGGRSERISVEAPESIAREIFETVIGRREAAAR